MTLYGKVLITDLGNNQYTLDVENRGWQLSLCSDDASRARIFVSDPDGTYESKYELGSKVEVYIDSSDPPTTKVFRGELQEMLIDWTGGYRSLVLDCLEYFYVWILNRIVDPRRSYHSLTTGEILKDLVSNYMTGFNTDSVQNLSYVLNDIVFNYLYLKECFDQLAEMADAQYYCDPLLNIYYYARESLGVALTITKAELRKRIRWSKSIVEMKNTAYVIGGNYLQEDQTQTTATTSIDMDAKYIAVKFTPTEKYLKQIALYLAKKGSPDETLFGSIVEDSSGQPTGPQIRSFAYTPTDRGATAGWKVANVEAELDVSKSYWIVLNKVGDSVDTYRLYHNNASNDTHAESTDGSTWTVYSGTSWRPAFKEYWGVPVIAKRQNHENISTYGNIPRETTVIDGLILDKATARQRAITIVNRRSEIQYILPSLIVKGSDLTSIPQVGKLVHVNISDLGINQYYVLKGLSIEARSGLQTVDEVVFDLGRNTW